MDCLLAGSQIEYISMRSDSRIKKPLVCRICMMDENLNPIFENGTEHLAEKIRDCGKVEVTRNDGLPEFICSNCVNKVDVCFDFKLKIQASDTLLRKMYIKNYTTNEAFSEEMGEPIDDHYYDEPVADASYDYDDIKLEIKPDSSLLHLHVENDQLPVSKRKVEEPQHTQYTDVRSTVRSKNGKFACGLCSLSFKAKKNLISHNKIVHEHQRFYCEQCECSYTTMEYLKLHKIDKHSDTSLTYECDICKKKFGHIRILKGHIKNHKAKIESLAKPTTGKTRPSTTADDVKPARPPVNRKSHICHICGTAFKGKSRVLYHIKTVHAEKPLFECDLCTQAYKDKKGLVNHKLVVHENFRFACDQCDASYRDKYMLTVHKLEKHSNLEPNIECHFCKKMFKHELFLKRHVRQTHKKNSSVSDQVPSTAPIQKEIKYNYCTACDKYFAHRLLFAAHKAEHNEKFECRICQKIFPSDRQLTIHKTIMHDNPMLQCEKCEYHTKRRHQLERHVKFVHDGFRFECEFCDKRFAKKKTAVAHRSTHIEQFKAEEFPFDDDDVKIDVKHELFLPIDIIRDTSSNGEAHNSCALRKRIKQEDLKGAEKKFICDKCGKEFRSKLKVAHHIQAVHLATIGQFECEVCFQKFKVNKSLQSHKRIVHEHRRYDCDLCDSSYTTKFVLDLHRLDKHSAGEPTVECEICHKKFGHERVLKSHLKSHKAKKPPKTVEPDKREHPKARPCNRKSHICHICGASFKGKSRVLNHIKYVHSDRPLFECDLCPQAYKDKKGLSNHKLVVHENHRWACDFDQCNVSYTAKYMLSLHKLEKHSNLEATHQCDICKKVYKHAIFLKRHKKTHNQNRLPTQPPLVAAIQKDIKYNYCTACDKNFAYRKLFVDHKLEHDGKFECRICQKIFPTDRTLTVHKSVIHDNPVLQCKTCDYNTTRPDLMKRHTKFVHDGFRFECEFCDKRFAKKKAADAHRITHTEGQAPDRDGFVIVNIH